MTIQDLEKNNRIDLLWILARYMYRVGGEPVMSDATYDTITRYLKEHNVPGAKEYLERTYDDDPVPEDLLKLLGMEPVEFGNFGDRAQYANALDEDKSLSINSVTSYEEAFQFCLEKRQAKLDLVASLKMDGVNHKDLYVHDKLKISMSRGRAGNGFDYTMQIYNCLPFQIATGLPELKVTGECYVDKKGIEVLRAKYNSEKYKTPKSAAISMLRIHHDSSDYKYLHAKVFAAEGLDTTLSGTFQKLKDMGFDVVPYLLIGWQEIPEDFTVFKEWFKGIMTIIHEEQLKDDMPADGMVLEVNDLLADATISGQYSSNQLACKFEYWAFEVYEAVVTDIVITQKRVYASCRIRIEPLKTKDFCEAKWINGFNPDILIRNGIRKGTHAFFERNSGAVNILIHGKRLDSILKE